MFGRAHGFHQGLAKTDTTWLKSEGVWVQSSDEVAVPGDAALTYDPVNRRVLGFGGTRAEENLSGTWSWDGALWVRLDALAPLPPGGRAALSFDGARRRPVLLAGDAGAFEWRGDRWSPVARVLPGDPTAAEMVYDAARGRLTANGSATFLSAHFASGPEACRVGLDPDGDGLTGCDDPDCWGYCDPLCPPGASCETVGASCGDGECSPDLETCRLCPSDCGLCTPVCGDLLCDPDEDPSQCPGDC